jgi:hypothetical protein
MTGKIISRPRCRPTQDVDTERKRTQQGDGNGDMYQANATLGTGRLGRRAHGAALCRPDEVIV